MAQTLQSAVDVWFASIGTAPDYKTMHYWEGANQSEFDINFSGGYISREHVKAFIRNDASGVTTPVAVTFLTASRVSVATPVPVGYTICIYRDTPKNAPLALFVDGAIMNAVNFDRNAKQSVFAVAELIDRFDATNSMAEEAILRASEAKTAAAQAAADAASAESKVAIAQSAATAAEASAQAAAALAGTADTNASNALSVANGIDAKATQALSNSTQAVATAQDAEAVANAIDGKATTALSQSSAAVATANTALTTANAVEDKAATLATKLADAQSRISELESWPQSGRTATTSWIKHRDGTMTATVTLTYGTAIQSPAGVLFQSDEVVSIPLPAGFIAGPAYSISIEYVSGTVRPLPIPISSTTSAVSCVLQAGTSVASVVCKYIVIAQGRWK